MVDIIPNSIPVPEKEAPDPINTLEDPFFQKPTDGDAFDTLEVQEQERTPVDWQPPHQEEEEE